MTRFVPADRILSDHWDPSSLFVNKTSEQIVLQGIKGTKVYWRWNINIFSSRSLKGSLKKPFDLNLKFLYFKYFITGLPFFPHVRRE